MAFPPSNRQRLSTGTERGQWSFAVICVLLAVPLFLSTGRLNARDADPSGTLAAAHTAKQQCINTCRARYRDCRHLNSCHLGSVGVFTEIAPDTLVLV
jgi:hypothetical protein